ncbi:MAG: hypothetical protein AAF657_08860 [Acidobacteriota bacterium]
MSMVLEILEWAQTPAGPPPGGPLDGIDVTLDSLAACNTALTKLVTRFAARHHLDAPPFGEAALDSSGPLMLARILGIAWDPRAARIVLAWANLPDAATPLEALARHVLIAPALPYLPEALADDLRVASPLTALVDRPAERRTHAAMSLALELLARADTRCFLVRTLAQPSSDRAVRSWRADLMEGLRGHSPESAGAVLDIYETAMVHHREEALDQVREAFAVLSDQHALDERTRLETTLALGDWWGPVAAMARANNQELRERLYLGYDFLQGLELHRAVNRLRGALR